MITYKDVLNEAAEELGIEKSLVDRVYKSFWKFIHTKMSELDLNNVETEEEFNQLQTNFNVPSLGKFYCTIDEFRQTKVQYKYALDKIKEKDKEYGD